VAIALTFLVSAIFGLQHVGVEEGWSGWLFQVGCAATPTGSITDLLGDGLSASAIPACGTKTPFLFGLTLAAYNLLFSLALAALAAAGAYHLTKDLSHERRSG
jgi:disulfide bond formation protein DsbB